MPNPILQRLQKPLPQNNILNLISTLKNGDPNAMFNSMMQNNPQFAEFVNSNKGKTPQQIAQENGVDFNSISNLLR